MAQVHTSYTNGRTGVISMLVRIKIDVGFIVNLKSIHLHTDRLCAAIVQLESRVGFGLSCTVSLIYQSINLCQPLDAPQPPWLLPSVLSPVTVTTAE